MIIRFLQNMISTIDKKKSEILLNKKLTEYTTSQTRELFNFEKSN